MTYTPDATRYQQLRNGDPYGGVDCTAWSAAWLTDAHTTGKTRLTGTEVRANSNEPHPDPRSPGLTLPQVDQSVYGLTDGKVNMDTHLGIPTSLAQDLLVDGRWGIVQVDRAVLVRAGYLTGFTGGHAVTVHSVGSVPVLGDPLVPYYVRAGWKTLWSAASALIGAPGRANVSFTRDLTPDYRVSVPTGSEFVVFTVTNNVIAGSHQTTTPGGIHQTCTVPRWYDWPGPRVGRRLVQITSGERKGQFIHAKWAYEVQP